MTTNLNTQVLSLFTEGFNKEAEGNQQEALEIFTLAFEQSDTNEEKYIAAQQIIKYQQTVEEKLHWYETALDCAINMPDEEIKMHLPSLFFNVGNCYELLQDTGRYHKNYELAFKHLQQLPVHQFFDRTIAEQIKTKFADVQAERKKLRNLR